MQIKDFMCYSFQDNKINDPEYFKKPTEELNEEEKLYAEKEPAAWYPVSRIQKKIKIKIPKNLVKIKNIIYIFWNKEKNRFLIGKTANNLNRRCSKYASDLNNKRIHAKVKKAGRKAFFKHMLANPANFSVGILHQLNSDEDIDVIEDLYIVAKRKVCQLYNDHRGGAGGLAHSEQKETTYAIPKDEALFTPQKYYPYKQNSDGRISIELTPGIKKELNRAYYLGEQIFYTIKSEEGESYVGTTGNGKRRAQEHGRYAKNPYHHSGHLPLALSECPEDFKFGILPVQQKEDLQESEIIHYNYFPTIARTEQKCIEMRYSHFTEMGFNISLGGNGSVQNYKKRKVRKKLDFDDVE